MIPTAKTLRSFALTVLAAAAPLTAQTLVIDGGTVHPVTAEPYVGRVVVVDGRIAAAGADVAGADMVVPADATTIDATGLHVYPGLFDSLSQLGMIEIGAVSATDDRTELGAYDPQLRATTAVHPASEVIPVTRENGITHTVVAPRPGRDSVIAGQAGLVDLAGWTVEEMTLDPSVAMIVRWPEVATRRFDFATYSYKDAPYTEAKEKAAEAQEELRSWLEAARHYAQAAAAGSTRLERDLKLEALAEVLDGRRPVVMMADEARDIEAAVAFAEKEGLRMILGGGRDAWKVKELLAEKNIPVLLGRTQSLPRDEDDPYDRPYRNPGELAGAGVKIAFTSGAGSGFGPGGPHSSRTIPYECAVAIGYGLSPDDALKALTLYPAQIFGVDDRLGSIEAGKLANLIVTDGDPLEITTRVIHLVIAGKEVSTANRQEDLYEKYRAR